MLLCVLINSHSVCVDFVASVVLFFFVVVVLVVSVCFCVCASRGLCAAQFYRLSTF